MHERKNLLTIKFVKRMNRRKSIIPNRTVFSCANPVEFFGGHFQFVDIYMHK